MVLAAVAVISLAVDMKKLSVLLLVVLLVGGWFPHGKTSSSQYNGKLVQTALGPTYAGGFSFVNYMMNAAVWTRQNGTTIDVSQLNAYGFPANMSDLGSHYQSLVTLPTAAEAGSTYTFDWVGYASIRLPGTLGTVSGAGCSKSGTDVTGPSCSVPITIDTSANIIILTVGDGSTNPQLTQMRLYLTSTATQVANCTTALNSVSISGLAQCFNSKFLTALADFGVIRFMNVQGENSANNPNALTHWADNRPLTWYSYQDYYFPNYLVTSNLVTSLGDGTDRYTLAFGGFTLTDKVQAIAKLNTQITITTVATNATSTVASCAVTCTLSFASVPANVVTGMHVADPAGSVPVIKPAAVISAVGATTITLTCVSPCTNPLLNQVTSGDTIYFSPMLNINSTGYVPLSSLMGAPNGFKNQFKGPLVINQYTLFTYDAALNAYITVNQTGINSGLSVGWPPAMAVALANVVGAHPWYQMPHLSVDPPSDYMSNLATFNRTNLKPGLIPRFEGINELWNYSYPYTDYADNKQLTRTDVALDHNNWYGQVMSQIGQQISTAYGSPSAANRTNYYWLIAGVQTWGAVGTKGGGGQAEKVDSPAYVTAGGSAAYNWLTHVAIAGYWNSAYENTVSELGWAYWYANGGTQSTLIADFLAGSTCTTLGACPGATSLSFNLPDLNTQMIAWYTYVASYAGTATIGLTQYEGGNIQCLAGTTTAGSGGNVTGVGCASYPFPSTPITAFTPGNPTVMTVTNNAYNYICNTASLCNGTTPTGLIASTGCVALDGQDPAIQSATSTTITVNLDSTGCTTSGTGKINYDGSTTSGTGYVQAFQYAVMQSSQLTPFELTNLQNFYTLGGRFPAEYDLADTTSWGKYSVDVYATHIPVITGVQQYNASP